jgi:DNA-binding CsgD family transcriptional regulator
MKLTDRQTNILKRFAEGKCVKEIAEELGIHENTVDYHKVKAKRLLKLRSDVEMIHYCIARLGVPLMFSLILLGCTAKPPPKQPIAAFAAVRAKVRTATAEVAPVLDVTKLRGCAWDYTAMPQGLFFEVWSSTNLTDWVLRTNTFEKVVVFPQKQREFYRVRANLNGLVSTWATTK